MSDEFGSNIEERKQRSTSKFRRTEFLKLTEGEHTIRILDKAEQRYYTHYLGFAYVKCLGDECPLCQVNKRILYEHPEDYKQVKGWNPRRDRYYINVLDITAVKVCPKCETEVKGVASLCPACNTVLGESHPANVVRVLTGSKSFFEDLKVLSNSVRNEQDERVDIRTYNWVLVTRGKGVNKVTSPSPRYNPAKADFLELPEGQELFDLSQAVITVTAEEMLDMANGASLKDIFTFRRAKKQIKEEEEADTSLGDILREELSTTADELFR